jgi:hypothetical protein
MDRKTLTSSTLEDLVDLDQTDQASKHLARQLLAAMNDWPTADLTIQEFVTVVENYFGRPLTIDRISQKRFNGQNAWQVEAGSSLAELIEMSTKLCNQSDFRTIVQDIVNYYEMINKDSSNV